MGLIKTTNDLAQQYIYVTLLYRIVYHLYNMAETPSLHPSIQLNQAYIQINHF